MRGTWTVVTLPKDLRRFGHNLSPPSPIRAIPICGSTSTKGITYRSIVVADDDEETRGTLRELGFMQLPVVWAPGVGYWAGFRPDKIGEIHEEVA